MKAIAKDVDGKKDFSPNMWENNDVSSVSSPLAIFHNGQWKRKSMCYLSFNNSVAFSKASLKSK